LIQKCMAQAAPGVGEQGRHGSLAPCVSWPRVGKLEERRWGNSGGGWGGWRRQREWGWRRESCVW
jgi:hypothetical protein